MIVIYAFHYQEVKMLHMFTSVRPKKSNRAPVWAKAHPNVAISVPVNHATKTKSVVIKAGVAASHAEHVGRNARELLDVKNKFASKVPKQLKKVIDIAPPQLEVLPEKLKSPVDEDEMQPVEYWPNGKPVKSKPSAPVSKKLRDRFAI